MGYWAKVKSYLAGDPAAQFDFKKLGKTALLGVLLGLGAYVAEEMANGVDVTVDMSNPGAFLKQVAAYMGAIYAIDRLVLSGRGGTKASAVAVNNDNGSTIVTVSTGGVGGKDTFIPPAAVTVPLTPEASEAELAIQDDEPLDLPPGKNGDQTG